MARKSTRRQTKRKQPKGPTIRPEIIGILLLILAGLTLLGLFTPNRGPLMATWLGLLSLLIGWGQYIFWFPLTVLAILFFKAFI